jgi:protoporphyrinogen/coproporphyrinogen III oxidase
MKRVVIIGAGITGLAAAHRLIERCSELRQPLDILLLEAKPVVGGTLQTDLRDGFLLERGPDSFISEKPEAINLARRLGIESNLIETNSENRRSFIGRDGKLKPVPEGFRLMAPSKILPFMTSGIFSLSGKARMAADLFLPRKSANGKSDESLADFVRRRLGSEALTRMAQPMIGGIYTADPEKLSLRATFPRFLDMESQHRSIILALFRAGKSATAAETRATSGARYSLFLTFDKGMQLLSDTLAKRITARQSTGDDLETKCEVRLNTRVESLQPEPGDSARKWRVRLGVNDSVTADAVCIALPAYVAAGVLADHFADISSDLASITYASTATINLGFRRSDIPHPLDGFGFVIPFVERRSLLACTFSSIKFPDRAPAGCVLLRAFVGGALQPEMFALDETEMITKVLGDLRELLGINKSPLFAETSKWARSMPQYELGHLDRVDSIRRHLAELPNLTLAGNAYSGAGVPDCIRSGETAAEELISGLGMH